MKIAVIGGGSTYTPELVSGLVAPRRRRSSCCTTSTPSGARWSAALARRMLDRAGLRGATRRSPTTSTAAVDGADFVLSRSASAASRRGSRDETVPARLRLHRPGDDRRRRLREGAAHRAGRARHRRARARARRAGRVDRRLHEPGRHRHARAARRGPSRGRSLQRRDRLPAHASRGCSASSRRASSSTRSGSTT